MAVYNQLEMKTVVVLFGKNKIKYWRTLSNIALPPQGCCQKARHSVCLHSVPGALLLDHAVSRYHSCDASNLNLMHGALDPEDVHVVLPLFFSSRQCVIYLCVLHRVFHLAGLPTSIPFQAPLLYTANASWHPFPSTSQEC